jgi:hypothetical protein
MKLGSGFAMQWICDFHLKSDENHAGSDITRTEEHIVKKCCERRHEHELLLSESELALPCNASSASWIRHTGGGGRAGARRAQQCHAAGVGDARLCGGGLWMDGDGGGRRLYVGWSVTPVQPTITRLRRVENLNMLRGSVNNGLSVQIILFLSTPLTACRHCLACFVSSPTRQQLQPRTNGQSSHVAAQSHTHQGHSFEKTSFNKLIFVKGRCQ